jgi:hypothetical protein
MLPALPFRTRSTERHNALKGAPARLRAACALCAKWLWVLLFGIAGVGSSGVEMQAQTYKITSAYFQETNGVLSTIIPAGVSGATLTLTGTVPTVAQQNQTSLLACFYTGYGSTAGLALALPNANGMEPLQVPAALIQAIPTANFTAANNFSVTAKVYFIQSSQVCDGTFDPKLTNQFSIAVVAPSLTAYSGPGSIPQTNAATGVQAAPTMLTLPALSYRDDSGTNGSVSSVSFGSLGTATAKLVAQNVLAVAVPAAYASSAAGTTAALSLCFTASPGSTYTVCTTPSPAITLTVAALAGSTGTITATPDPVLTSGQTVITAQFANTGSASGAGAPSGIVSFVADGTTLTPGKLILDKTATFSAQSTTVTTPAAATPAIAPAAGAYTGAQTITITDSSQGAKIYYTQDGSTPSPASTAYTGPFSISTSQTIQAIAAVSGALNSAVASAAYTITINPPTQLAFAAQPVNSGVGAVITPAVQVAIEDANGNVVTSATNAVTLAFGRNPGEARLGGTLTVSAVNGIATFPDLTINQIANNYSLNATSGNLLPVTSNLFNITLPPIAMTVQSALVGIGSTLSGTFTLAQAAPTGGVTVNLSSSTPANVTIAPASASVAQGQTTGSFTYTGVATGSSTLSASATNYQTGTVQATGTAAQVSLGTIPAVAPGQMVSLALSLATPAPAGGTTVTFTSSNPSVATVTASVFVPAGQQTAATNPQVTGIIIGTTNITANAPGYAPAVRAVNVTVVATFSPATTNINLSTATTTTLNVSAPAQTGGLTFTLSSDDPTVATVPSSVTVVQGSTSVVVPITGVKAGSTTIRADSTGVTEATGTVNVSSAINGGSLTTGYDLQNSYNLYLPVSPPNPVTVTVTSNNPAVAVISKTGTAVGQTTLSYPNITSSFVATIYVQGLSIGSTTLTISAPGYTTGTTTITVDPSGFVYYGTPNFSTTSFSAPTNEGIYPVILTPGTLTVYSSFGYAINPGSAAISVPVTSSATSVGTVASPVVFHAGDTSQNMTFTPVGPGTSTIAIGTPPTGFSVASQYESITATVTAPAISASNATTAVHLQSSMSLYLPVTPPTPVTVTVTSNGPAIATLAPNATTVGSTTITYTNVTSTYIGTMYVQGQSAGTTTYTMSAAGYTSGSATITGDLSGFVYYGTPSFSTTTLSTPQNVSVYTAALNSQTMNVDNFFLPLSPGVAAVSVPVTSSNTTVGTITTSPLVFHPGDTGQTTTFQPSASGTSNLTIGTPSGYTASAQYEQITATVSSPAISVSNVTTGVHLQYGIGIYLPVTPPTPVTVTVTVSAPGVATLSNSLTATGVTTLTFTNVSSTYVGTIYVQGQSVGSATITESAPGYTTGTSTATVDPSGFVYYGTPNISTTTFSSASTITVYAAVLNPSSLTVQNFQLPLNPGVGPVTVPVVNSNPTVGTLASSALVFNTGDSYQQTTFTPVSAGTANLTLGVPMGFSTPAQYTQITATVTAPAISVGNTTTGVNLETTLGIYLPVSPPNAVTVTVTSNGPLISTISNSGTVVGGTTLTFPNITGTYVGTIYVQGASLGSTTITVSAPGYTNGNGTVLVNPSGFTFYGSPSFTISTAYGPYGVAVYPTVLNPGTLTADIIGQQLSPVAGTVSVPVTSSNTGVGTITNSPLAFMPGASYVTGTSTITIQTPTGFSAPSQYTQATGTVQ